MVALITAEDVRAELERQITVAGGLVKWCGRAGLSHAPVSLAKNGARPITEQIANACGFEVVTRYRRVSRGVS